MCILIRITIYYKKKKKLSGHLGAEGFFCDHNDCKIISFVTSLERFISLMA